MIEILAIAAAALAVTFLIDLIFRDRVERHPFIVGKIKIHHSVLGLALLIAGLTLGAHWLLAVGLGIYLAHGFEEAYFNKTAVYKAFFVLITRQ